MDPADERYHGEPLSACRSSTGLNGVIAGGTTLFKTMNGGATWVPEETPSSMADVVYINPVNVAAVGGSENVISRSDVPVGVFFQGVTAKVRRYEVELRWSVLADEGAAGFRIYRTEGDGPEAVVNNELIELRVGSFVDRGVTPGDALPLHGGGCRGRPLGDTISVGVGQRATYAGGAISKQSQPVQPDDDHSVRDSSHGTRDAERLRRGRPASRHAHQWD